MPDSYHLPALVLTVLLLPAFAQLYLRSKDIRTLLWFLGFLFAIFRMLQFYDLGWGDYSDITRHPWIAAAGQTSILISSALFLASLAPRGFRIGRYSILYAVPFAIPLVAPPSSPCSSTSLHVPAMARNVAELSDHGLRSTSSDSR